MGVSVVTLALARKAAKKSIDNAVAQAIQECKQYTDDKFDEIVSFKIKIVDELPPLSEADSHTIYFVPRQSPSGEADYYYEYMVIDDKWELLGSTELDLTNYWTIDQIKSYVESQEYTLPPATKNTLGGVKIDDTSIGIDRSGTISIIPSYIEQISEDKTQELIDANFQYISDADIDNLFN